MNDVRNAVKTYAEGVKKNLEAKNKAEGTVEDKEKRAAAKASKKDTNEVKLL